MLLATILYRVAYHTHGKTHKVIAVVGIVADITGILLVLIFDSGMIYDLELNVFTIHLIFAALLVVSVVWLIYLGVIQSVYGHEWVANKLFLPLWWASLLTGLMLFL